jgi:arylsulfatase A-like enzyme
MIIYQPGAARNGGRCDEPVISTDFYPTILEMAGLPAQPAQHLDGISLVPLLEGREALLPRSLYWHYPHYGNQGGSPGSAIRRGNHKLVKFYEDDRIELYDLSLDMEERTDLSGSRPFLARELKAELEAWLEEAGARYPTPNPEVTKQPQHP